MEQTIVDFFVKSSELILQNRFKTAKNVQAASDLVINPTLRKFQLSFEQKFNFSTKIPPQWSVQSNKLLVLEFFLSSSATKEKFLVEQWVFELNQVDDDKIKDTIDSPLTLYKKLSMLLRSISLLTMTLPLHKYFLSDKTNNLWKYYTLEHSINFTRHNLSHWHPSVHEEKNLANYTNPELVLPGRTFSFKVTYPPSFQFLLAIIENETSPISKSLKEPSPTFNEGGSGSLSPIGSILAPSPIETQKSSQLGGSRSRKSSGVTNTWVTKNSLGSRQRFGTIDSGSGEYDMYIYEDKGGTLTEIEPVKEIDPSEDFNIQTKINGDSKLMMSIVNRLGVQDLKLPGNVRQVAKITEHSDDDKLAEIIQLVEELKDHFYSMSPEEDGSEVDLKNGNKKRLEGTRKKGFKFNPLDKGGNKTGHTLSTDFENLGVLYTKLKPTE